MSSHVKSNRKLRCFEHGEHIEYSPSKHRLCCTWVSSSYMKFNMTQLNDFFRQKKARAESESAGIDWEQRKTEWLSAIQRLYEQIRAFLDQPIRQGAVRLDTRKKTITEPHLGQYEADELVLTVGDERVLFSPKGRNVVGATGRVDVLGEAGEATLVLQPGPRWCVVASKYPQLRIVGLDEENFLKSLSAVMRP